MKQLLLRSGIFCLGLASVIPARADYARVDTPRMWTVEQPTPAYDPVDPDHHLGDFQPGFKVEVLSVDPGKDHWRVRFPRPGYADIEALIGIPSALGVRGVREERVTSILAGFPLLESLLKAESPWELEMERFQARFQGELEEGAIWGIYSLRHQAYPRQGRPYVQYEIWNKGDAFLAPLEPSDVSGARRVLREKLEDLAGALQTDHLDGDPGASRRLRSARDRSEYWLLPNFIRARLRYLPGEYLILELGPAYGEPQDRSPGRNLLADLRHTDSSVWIDNIPMIDQGQKGYCAAATLARVLQHYGYEVDQHDFAELANTEAQITFGDTGGTYYDDVLKAMRRACDTTPYRMKQVSREDPEVIREVLEQGTPIIWFVPGHARLLIGLDWEEGLVFFSDSWGPGHALKAMSWQDFLRINWEMWVLVE